MANFYGSDVDDSQLGGFVDYYGGAGADSLQGTDLTNQIYGGAGNDLLVGAVWNAITGDGSAANPWFYTSIFPSGGDYIEGGAGNDIIHGGDGNDTLYGGDGNDAGTVLGWGLVFWRAGLYGGDGDDYLDGGRGDDFLSGGKNNDTLVGGAGNDWLEGDDGNDTIFADQGTDFANGGDGNDTIVSGLANGITAFGGNGNDIIGTGVGNDTLNGGANDDNIFAGGGNDIVGGGAGNDWVGGGDGNDQLYGEAGTDFFNLIADVRTWESDYLGDFNSGGTADYIALPAAYAGYVNYFQYGADVIGFVATGGAGYYSFYVDGAAALSVAQVEAQTMYF